MLNVTELRNGAVFQEGKDLLLVLTYEHNKMGRGSGTIRLKVKNLRTGSVTEKSFITGARVEEASVEKKKAQFLYSDREGGIEAPSGDSYHDAQYYFMDPETFEQFTISYQILGDQAKYLKDGLDVQLLVNEAEALALELPNTVVYEIKETGPEEKGNTVSNVYKEAILDNDLVVKVPMFMHAGEKVKVDTRSGQYVERVK